MKVVLSLFLLVLAALTPCSGAVIYHLVGTSTLETPPFAVDFKFTAPDFITADTTILAADMTSCSTGFESCVKAVFEPKSSHDPTSASIEFITPKSDASGPGTLFFFALGAFSNPANNPTTFGAGTGTLWVMPQSTSVPEPGTAVLAMASLGGLFAFRRFRR